MKKKVTKKFIAAVMVFLTIFLSPVTLFAAEKPQSTTGDNVVRVSAAGATSIIVEMLGANLVSTSVACLNGTSMPQLLPVFSVNNENADPYLANHQNKKIPAAVIGWGGSGPGTPIYDTGAGTSPIVTNNPDIVGGFSDQSTPTLSFLQAASNQLGFTTTLISPASPSFTSKDGIEAAVTDYAATIEKVMAESGKTTRYEKKPSQIAKEYKDFYDSNVELVQDLVKDAPEVKVLYVSGSGSGVYTVLSEESNDIFATYHMGVAKGKNVGVGTQMISAQIKQANPDIIVTGSSTLTSTLKADDTLDGTKAFIDGKIYTIPTGAYGWRLRSPESCLAPLWLAKILHPDETKSLDLYQKVYSFYDTFYHYKNVTEDLSNVVFSVSGFAATAPGDQNNGGDNNDDKTPETENPGNEDTDGTDISDGTDITDGTDTTKETDAIDGTDTIDGTEEINATVSAETVQTYDPSNGAIFAGLVLISLFVLIMAYRKQKYE